MLCRVALVRTDVSEELSISFIRVTRISELGTMLVVTSNRRTHGLGRFSILGICWASGVWLVHRERCRQKILLSIWRQCPRIYSEELKNTSRKMPLMQLTFIARIRPNASLSAICRELHLRASLGSNGFFSRVRLSALCPTARTLYTSLPMARWLNDTPTILVHISLPSTTRETTKDLFWHASTREYGMCILNYTIHFWLNAWNKLDNEQSWKFHRSSCVERTMTLIFRNVSLSPIISLRAL
jgi:hypothetical protein